MKKSRGLPKDIKKILEAREPEVIPDKEKTYNHAAVLIPLFEYEGTYKLLLTKRTDQVDKHKGQISFPGGAVDETDSSFEDTALRETHEEIGLKRWDVEILGRTDDTLTLVSNFVIHPFVGFFDYPYDFVLNPFEVERMIEVPLEAFNPRKRRMERFKSKYDGKTYSTPAYVYGNDLIWGATARVIAGFIQIISQKIGLQAFNK